MNQGLTRDKTTRKKAQNPHRMTQHVTEKETSADYKQIQLFKDIFDAS